MADSQSDIGIAPEKPVSKRAERRAKQRAANPMRAEKMHKYRLAHPLAPVKTQPPLLNIGCSGWFYWDWKGLFYPTQMPTNEWFPHYAESFDTVEINASFYSWPTVAGVKAWMRGLRDDVPFVFTVKASELITHVRRFEETGGLVEDFGYVADLLGERMGCLLFQLPPSIKYDPDLLRSIVSQLEPQRRNVVEFRHASWWNAEVYAALRDAGIMFCATSGPKLPDDLIRTTDEIYVRFHGTDKWYNYRYTDAEIADWAKKIADSGARRVWVYFNNDYHGNAIDNARQLREALNVSGFGA